MLYVSHIIMLCTLNLHSAIYQLYLNKTARKKEKVFKKSMYIESKRMERDESRKF